MRPTSFNLLALLAITALTDALPFTPGPCSNRPLRRTPVTYSVVPVDGGSTTTPVATTVIKSETLPPVTETQLSTLLSTIVVTAFETPSTIVITVTATSLPPLSTGDSTPIPESTPAPSYSQHPSPTTVTSAVTECTTSATVTTTSVYTEFMTTTSIATLSTVISATTLPPEMITVTALPSSTPYDNGMWHTTYFHPVDEATSTPSYSYTPTTSYASYPSEVPPPLSASTTLDTNIGIPVNGTRALGPRDDVVRTSTTGKAQATYVIAAYHPTSGEA